jgi:SET domain-containing protein
MKESARRRKPLFEVRHSRIHGYGVFALRRIRKGTTVIEYLGDRVSHDAANERYEDKDPKDGHTFLFTVDAKTVIDAGVDGNEARFVNHGCDPNCQTVNTNKRIFIEALRTIQPGEELAYDYQIQRDDDDPADVDLIFACRCGAQSCRGSMLEARKRKRKSARKKASKAKPRARRKAPRRRKAVRKAVRKGAPKAVRNAARKRQR